MAESGIYEIVNLVNGKRYVGSAVHFQKRWNIHLSLLNRGKHHSRHLQASWLKYGEAAFEFRIILLCDPDNLIAEENAEFQRRKPEYNVCPEAGSSRGRRFSDESKEKIGAALRGQKRPPRDEEYRRNISKAQKGKPRAAHVMEALQAGRRAHICTDEQRAAKAAGMKRAYAEGRHRRDRPPEYRAKIAATLRGRKATSEHRANQSAAQRGKKRGPYRRAVNEGQGSFNF